MSCKLEEDVNDVIKVAFGYLQRPRRKNWRSGLTNWTTFGTLALESRNLLKKCANVEDTFVQVKWI